MFIPATCALEIGDAKIPFKLAFRDVDTDKRYETTGYEVHIEVREPQKSALPNPMLFAVVLGIIVFVVVLVGIGVKRKRGRRKVE